VKHPTKESAMNPKTRNIAIAAVLALVLVAGVFWGSSSGDSSDDQGVAADAPTTSSTSSPSTTESTESTPTPDASAPAPSGSDGSGTGGGGTAGDDTATPPATTPSIGAVTLTADAECVSLPDSTGCDEIVVPQLFVSVVNGNGTVTTFLDTGSSTQLSLVPREPLTISQPAASGVDPADINRVEVRLFEHMTGRDVQVSVEDNGSLAVNVPTNNPGEPTWTLRFTVDGLV
jgi:hypothetical protein